MNFYKYIFGTIFFFCLLVRPVFAEELNLDINENTTETDIQTIVSGGRDPKDMYLLIYESTKNDIETKTLERVAKQNNFSQEDLQSNLNGVFTDDLVKKCEELFQSNTSQSLYQCISLLKDNYEYEKKLITLETTLKGDAEASEIWSDGDLSNSFFDLIVDLNIIEIILFGENTYEYPFSDSYNFDSTSTNNDDNDTENSVSTEDTEDNNQDDDNDTNEDNETINICQDPEEIILDQAVWSGESDDNTTDNNNCNSSENDNPYKSGSFQFPQASDDCGGESLFLGLLCIDEWPCEDFFCIKISTIPQDAGGASQKATFIQELITTGIQELNYLKGHSLTVHKNSNERFIISVGKFFDRPISLDVITQGIPIKLVPKDSAFDKEENVLEKLNTTLCEKTGGWCYENGDNLAAENETSRIINSREDILQQETFQAVSLNSEKLQANYEDVKETWKKAQEVKHKQNFWEEFRKNLNIMVLYFESMTDIFLQLETTGMDILNETGNSCN